MSIKAAHRVGFLGLLCLVAAGGCSTIGGPKHRHTRFPDPGIALCPKGARKTSTGTTCAMTGCRFSARSRRACPPRPSTSLPTTRSCGNWRRPGRCKAVCRSSTRSSGPRADREGADRGLRRSAASRSVDRSRPVAPRPLPSASSTLPKSIASVGPFPTPTRTKRRKR